MRLVAKGPPPQIQYSHYRDALDDLADRLGLFYSYCEQPIQHAPEIEHVQPKSLEPDLERSWDNLGCSSCNKTKSNNPVDLTRVAMPDTDNTFRGLEFLEGGKIELSPHLNDEQTELMRQVVGLVRLDRHPDASTKDGRPTDRDKRAKLRNDVWILANRYRGYIEQRELNPEIHGKFVGDVARSNGFFSVWMTVFRDYPDMLKRFLQIFPGTDADCFDGEGRAVPRPGGRF